MGSVAGVPNRPRREMGGWRRAYVAAISSIEGLILNERVELGGGRNVRPPPVVRNLCWTRMRSGPPPCPPDPADETGSRAVLATRRP